MTEKKKIFCAHQGLNYYSANLSHNSGMIANKRPYNMETMFDYEVFRNLDQDNLYTLANDHRFSVKTTATDGERWVESNNITHMLKDSDINNVSYGWSMMKNQSNDYYNTFGVGGGVKNKYGIKSYYLSNVVGMSFSWSRHGSEHSKGYISCPHFGMCFYSPSQQKWRQVRFTAHRKETNNYYSP